MCARIPKSTALPVERRCDSKKGKANAISVHPCLTLCLAGTLAVAADDLDPVRRHRGLVIQLECDILDQERPNFVAESVGIQVTLLVRRNVMLAMLKLK
jgi:hypothetical protein